MHLECHRASMTKAAGKISENLVKWLNFYALERSWNDVSYRHGSEVFCDNAGGNPVAEYRTG